MRKYFFFLIFLALPVITSAATLVGGDRDAHGCIGSAGYVWSAPMKECIRTWEHYKIDLANPPVTGAAKLDAIIAKKVDVLTKAFRHDAEFQIHDLGLTGSTNYEFDVTYQIVNTGSVISVYMDTYTFLGGAHGMAVAYTWNYDTKTQKVLPTLQVISRKNLAIAAKNIENYIMKNYTGYADALWVKTGTSWKRLQNYRTFAVHTDASGKIDAVTFYFADYQVLSHAAGRPAITIALPTLEVIGNKNF